VTQLKALGVRDGPAEVAKKLRAALLRALNLETARVLDVMETELS
jgi:hypothetical protein